jgi:hypothetical protein
MQKVFQNATPTKEGYDTKKPIFIGSKIFFRMARYVHLYIGRKEETLERKKKP